MRVIKWPQSHSDGSCVNKNVRGNKGFYSIFIKQAVGDDTPHSQMFQEAWASSSSVISLMKGDS